MKKLLLFLFVGFMMASFAQKRAVVSKDLRDLAVPDKHSIDQTLNLKKNPNPFVLEKAFVGEEEIIGGTRYDLQSNAACQNRLANFGDGTMAAAWTYGAADPGFPGRGTGYVYFDGDNWGTPPDQRIESQRSGWPSIAPLGPNGEIVVAHISGGNDNALIINSRDTKGTGAWTETLFLPPPGATPNTSLLWPRMITSGPDHNRVHIIAVTTPVANGGDPYEGMDGALLYSQSNDGGQTWDQENVFLPGMDANNYTGFSGDTYSWAEPKDDNLAFVIGDSWTDLILMKSTDGGTTWEKTVIWENPYPMFDPANPTVTDTFYCADGSSHAAIDSDGTVHVVFGINRAHSDGSGTFWFPFIDGVAYWNETMPTFSNDFDALSPYDDPNSELVEDYNLIGWSQDVDGDGEITFVGTAIENIGTYYLSLSSMVQIHIGQWDDIHVVFSSVTETFDNSFQNYRHLWWRGSSMMYGGDWSDDFIRLTDALLHNFDECVFPSVAGPPAQDNLHLIFQTDNEPGLAVRGDEDDYTDNNIYYMKLPNLYLGTQENILTDEEVSQVYPNPVSATGRIEVTLRQAADLSMEVYNLIGQQVLTVDAGNVDPGVRYLTFDASQLDSGIYFCTIKAGDSEITRKLMVE